MKTAPCPLCGGEGHELGVLGPARWFRCRACGGEFHKQVRRAGGFLRSGAQADRQEDKKT